MIPDDTVTLLRIHRSTRGLSDEQVQSIAEQAEVVRSEADCVVHSPDDLVRTLVLVVSGRLRMSVALPGGRENTIMFLGHDEQFGLLGLAQEDPFPVRVIAEQKSVLIRIPIEPANRLLQEIPLWGRNLLQSLGPQLRHKYLGEKRVRMPRFVLLIHTCDESRHLTALLVEQLTHLGERVGLLSDHADTLAVEPAHSTSLFDVDGQLLTNERIRSLIAEWAGADRIVLDVHLKHSASQLTQLVNVIECSYWFCTSDSTEETLAELKRITKASPSQREKICVVRVLNEREPVAPLVRELDAVCNRDFKLHWNGFGADSPVRSQRAGLDRLIHHLRGVSIGLALGGGAARGMAHLGVLQVLEQAGITLDRMSGTSAGALAGILYAAGYSADFLVESFSRDLKPGWLYRMLPYGDALYVLQKYRFGGWEAMLRKYVHAWRLEQLSLPFSSVAVDLVSATPVVRREGDAVDALLESINLPGIARPICRDGKALVDGGVLNVVPADVVVNQGANLVIASDVAAKISFEFAGNRPETPTDRMHVPHAVSTLVRMRVVQDRNIRSVGGQSADIVIEPDVSTVQLTDFKDARRIAELGRAAAQESLAELRKALHETDPQLFPQ